MTWHPHLTVATIIEKNGQYLMVEEVKNNQTVINQPAGHLEANESLITAAIRETLEETQWEIEVTGLLGCTLYTSPANNITYFRTSFIGKPIQLNDKSPLDEDIERAVWMSKQAIEENKDKLRSDMVLNDINRYEKGELYPLHFIKHIINTTMS